MRNRLVDAGVVVILGSTLSMTMQQSFEFGYGIAAGIAIAYLGMLREKRNKRNKQ